MSEPRIENMVKRCRTRGGDCQCLGRCQADLLIAERMGELRQDQLRIQRQLESLEDKRNMVNTRPATLKDDFTFRDGLTPVMVFDGREAMFGYEDAKEEWEPADEWPFEQGYIWADDCERHGIRVETA